MLSQKQKKIQTLLRSLNVLPKDERKKYTIKDLKKGSFFTFEKVDYYIEEVATYLDVKWKNFSKRKENYFVYEFKSISLNDASIVYFEWEEDDEIECSMTTQTLKIKDISLTNNSNNKISLSDLEDIADDEEGKVYTNDKYYEYSEDDTWAALYSSDKYTDCKVRMYEFYNHNEYLTIEIWEDDEDKPEKEAFISKEIYYQDIEVLKV